MTPLFAEINRWKSMPFEWGACDCMTVLGDWLHSLTGFDPLAGVRGTYDGPISCQRVTGFIHDPMKVCDDLFGKLPMTKEPEVGDIAVIRRKDDPRWPMGAVFVGSGWACKGPNGAVGLNKRMVTVLGAWSVGYEA